MSSSAGPQKVAAMIFKSGILRTNAMTPHRPNPTMFYFPGLNSKPLHETRYAEKLPLNSILITSSSKVAWVQHLEDNWEVRICLDVTFCFYIFNSPDYSG